jgi:histone deacetylase 6
LPSACQTRFQIVPQVLYVSSHRYEQGAFWPNLRESNFDAVGAPDTKARGYNVNVPLNEIGSEKIADHSILFLGAKLAP